MATFGERLKELRKKKHLTQEQLGKAFYLNKSSISRYENDTQIPENELLQSIADYFDVSLDYLMGRTSIVNTHSNIVAPTKKEQKNHDTFMEDAKALFMNGELDEDDKEKIFKDISDLFWESKKINKEKYSKKK